MLPPPAARATADPAGRSGAGHVLGGDQVDLVVARRAWRRRQGARRSGRGRPCASASGSGPSTLVVEQRSRAPRCGDRRVRPARRRRGRPSAAAPAALGADPEQEGPGAPSDTRSAAMSPRHHPVSAAIRSASALVGSWLTRGLRPLCNASASSSWPARSCRPSIPLSTARHDGQSGGQEYRHSPNVVGHWNPWCPAPPPAWRRRPATAPPAAPRRPFGRPAWPPSPPPRPAPDRPDRRRPPPVCRARRARAARSDATTIGAGDAPPSAAAGTRPPRSRPLRARLSISPWARQIGPAPARTRPPRPRPPSRAPAHPPSLPLATAPRGSAARQTVDVVEVDRGRFARMSPSARPSPFWPICSAIVLYVLVDRRRRYEPRRSAAAAARCWRRAR